MKKNLVALILLLGLTSVVIAQDGKKKEIRSADVPAKILNTFKSAFPNASDIEWKKTDDNYKVSFDLGRIEHHATINPSGTIIAQGHEIAASELPQQIKSSIKKEFPNYRIDEVDVMKSDGQTVYKVNLDGAPDKKVTYSADGKVIKEKVDKD